MKTPKYELQEVYRGDHTPSNVVMVADIANQRLYAVFIARDGLWSVFTVGSPEPLGLRKYLNGVNKQALQRWAQGGEAYPVL